MPDFIEPRRECQRIRAHMPWGDVRRCGSHVRATERPGIAWCEHCQAEMDVAQTQSAIRPTRARKEHG